MSNKNLTRIFLAIGVAIATAIDATADAITHVFTNYTIAIVGFIGISVIVGYVYLLINVGN